jgi:hypothetical protein
MQKLTATAVIPAHNEGKTVGNVVLTVVASGFFREVIVVSDGSTDDTAQVAREAGATLVHELSHRRGKGLALAHGVMHTDADVICFLDADLRGLTVEHVGAILGPVASGERYMNIGLRDQGVLRSALARSLPWVSGQRALRREVFDAIPGKFMAGFGVETALNFFCSVNALPFGIVQLKGLGIITKVGKVGLLRAIPQYARMWAQVAAATVRLSLARKQFIEHGTHMSHHH